MKRMAGAAFMLLCSAAAAEPLQPGEWAWNCRFTASYECTAKGCRPVGAPDGVGVLSRRGYFHCADVPFCPEQPGGQVRDEGEIISAVVPESNLAARFANGRIVETVAEQDRTVTSFGACKRGLPALLTPTGPATR